MKSAMKKPRRYGKMLTAKKPEERIKVQLDYRTTIMINRRSSFKVWKRLYPLAHIIK